MLQSSGFSKAEVVENSAALLNALSFLEPSHSAPQQKRHTGMLAAAPPPANTKQAESLESQLASRAQRLDRLSTRLSPINNAAKTSALETKLKQFELGQKVTTQEMIQQADEPAAKQKGEQTSSSSSLLSPPPLSAALPLAAVDYTKIPVELDAKLLALDSLHAVSTAIIAPGKNWEVTSQESLLSSATREPFPPPV